MANLSAQVPNPAFFNAMATSTAASGTTLSRKESAVHISSAYAPFRSNRMEFRLMGGPSFFTLKGDMVREVEYEQTFNTLNPQNTVTISGFSSAEASGSSIGYHWGADFTYFVHRFIGVAGGVRYGRAIVAVETEPLSNIEQEFLRWQHHGVSRAALPARPDAPGQVIAEAFMTKAFSSVRFVGDRSRRSLHRVRRGSVTHQPNPAQCAPFAAIQVVGPDSVAAGQSVQFVATIRQADGTTKSATSHAEPEMAQLEPVGDGGEQPGIGHRPSERQGRSDDHAPSQQTSRLFEALATLSFNPRAPIGSSDRFVRRMPHRYRFRAPALRCFPDPTSP